MTVFSMHYEGAVLDDNFPLHNHPPVDFRCGYCQSAHLRWISEFCSLKMSIGIYKWL